MRKKQSSLTAMGITVVRAIEFAKPDSFGIPEGTIQAFLEQRGFERVQNATHVQLHAAYFTGANHKRKVTDGYAIVSAVVKERKEQP